MRKYRVFSPIFRIEIHLDKAKSYRITAPTAAHHCVFTSISVWTTLTMLKSVRSKIKIATIWVLLLEIFSNDSLCNSISILIISCDARYFCLLQHLGGEVIAVKSTGLCHVTVKYLHELLFSRSTSRHTDACHLQISNAMHCSGNNNMAHHILNCRTIQNGKYLRL